MLSHPLTVAARLAPAAPALEAEGIRYTYGQLAALVDERARRLASLGVTSGQVVALLGANSAEWIIHSQAIIRLGAILLPLSTRWTILEISRSLAQTGASLLIAAPGFAGSNVECGCPVWTYQQIASGPNFTGALPSSYDPLAPMALILTSGTTGTPKAVTLSWKAILASAHGVATALTLGESDNWWLGMPLFHVGGLSILFRCWLKNAVITLAPRFDAERLAETLHTGRISLLSVVPTMLQALLDVRGEKPWPTSLRVTMLGGAAAPAALIKACPTAIATYGLSEAASTVTLGSLDDAPEMRLSSGRALLGNQLRILADDGRPVPLGAWGAIALQGPTVMSGYWRNEAATNQAIQEGWLITSDIGRLDEHGCLSIAARREDLIVSGGENIYPAEIEQVLLAHPHITAAAVVAQADARWGQVPCAWLVTQIPLDTENLQQWLMERLARYKHPRRYEFIAALPLLANGKVDRRALRNASQKPSA